MPLTIVRHDITLVGVDAIVNAANRELQQGGGVCGAIFAAAGAEQLQAACDALRPCEIGQSVITPGFNLLAKYIIHAVGPIWRGGRHGEPELLASCYRTALQLAVDYKLKSIAFPLIASGIYGYPKDQAIQIATRVIGEFLFKHELNVSLVVFDKNAFELSGRLFYAVQTFIDDNYVESRTDHKRSRLNEPDYMHPTLGKMIKHEIEDDHYEIKHEISEQICSSDFDSQIDFQLSVPAPRRKLTDLINHLDETFTEMVLRLIDEKKYKDSDVYKKANIDRRLFSKIRSDRQYQPSKVTVIALATSLELNLDELNDLLLKAGFALSRSNRFDVIIEFFFTSEDYDIYTINQVLFQYDQPLLGS
ncbi:MAG: macro domain-containing protein [Eubacteriales bacterium]|nr:macro domain-containing protein [Eubacteriales bacterium]